MAALLKSSPRRGRARRGFTLIEMLVALGVLLIALSIATAVFGVTSKVTRQAAAANEINSILDAFISEIDEDLNGIDPTRSTLVICGRTQGAPLTEEKRVANQYYRVLVGDPNAASIRGYNPLGPLLDNADPNLAQYSNPRADLLMFFSQRSSSSRSPAEVPVPNTNPPPGQAFQYGLMEGTKTAPVRVMIGHAALARLTGGMGNQAIDPVNARDIEQTDHAALCPIPANRWQLVRQAALIEPIPYVSSSNLSFTAATFRRLLTGLPGTGDNLNGWNGPRAGDSAPLALAEFFQALQPFKNPVNNVNDPTTGIARARPYEFDPNSPRTTPLTGVDWNLRPPSAGGSLSAHDLVQNIFFNPGDANARTKHRFALVVEDPPANLADNLAMERLPGCVWFQVEFLMPEDPRNSLSAAAILPPALDSTQTYQRDDLPRWVSVPDGMTYAFVPDTSANRSVVEKETNAQRRLDDFGFTTMPIGAANQPVHPVRMWPYAIRLTFRVYDRLGQLDQPVIRTLVHRFP